MFVFEKKLFSLNHSDKFSNMKKICTSIVLLFLSFTLLPAQNPNNPKSIGSSMPQIKMVTGKMKTYYSHDFKNDYNLFVVMFNPTCGHCLTMTKLIGAHHDLFKNNHVVFLAGDQMMPYLKSYEEETSIYKYPEMIVGVDSSHFVDGAFAFGTLPQINIYNKERKLIKVFNGDTPIDSLKKYIY